MSDFLRGQKGKLIELGCTGAFPIELNVVAPGFDIDIACFGLDDKDMLSDDRYMVFFNQKRCPGDGVILEIGNGKSIFTTDVLRLPDSICKLVFTATISGNGTMKNLAQSSMRLGNIFFPFSGSDFTSEKAVIIGELYRRDGLWRFGAVGQGFNGGMSALLKHFGGVESDVAPAPTPPPEKKSVSLTKVTLEKRGDKVSLEKSADRGFGRIRVNLNWDQNGTPSEAPKKRGFLNKMMGGGTARNVNNIDLDLGCFFELSDGTAGGVQALGDSFGNFDNAPFIHLDGDDRSGSNLAGENLFINGDKFINIKRVLIFAFIYEGVPNWTATNGVVIVEAPGQGPVEVRLENGSNASMCAIAMIENTNGKLQVTKLEEYFQAIGSNSTHKLMNDRFGFGLNFRVASKD